MSTTRDMRKLLQIAKERSDLFNPKPLPVEFFHKPSPKFMYILEDAVGNFTRKYPEYRPSIVRMGNNFQIETIEGSFWVVFKDSSQPLRIQRFFANGYACKLRALQLEKRSLEQGLKHMEKKIAELAAKIGPAPP